MIKSRFADLTSEQLIDNAPKALVIIPIGSLEQHGPHLPVGIDSFNVEQIALKVADKMQNSLILVAPTIWYGSSHHHLKFTGTMSLRGKTLLSVLCDLGNSLAKGGFKKIFFLNGHGGNTFIIREAARELVHEYQNDIIVGSASYWEIAKEALSKIDIPKIPGHAGTFETSLQLARDEGLVNREAMESFEKGEYNSLQYRAVNGQERNTLRFNSLKEKAHFQRFNSYRKIGGVSETTAKSSPELGEELLDIITEELAHFFADFLKHP